MRGKRKSSEKQFALRILPLTLFLVFSLFPFSSWGFQSKDGQSVAPGNPESASVQTTYASIDDEEVTPETWRTINLEMRKADGSVAKIDLLRPLWWLEEAGAEVGGTIPLSMQEMGIEGDAKVLNIGPCKADSRTGDPRYRVVTGNFTHENAIVLDLYFNNNPNETLGVTPNHPLWSETRNGWVEAGQLKIGEYVKTKDGTAKLTKRSQRSGRHKVYNLEVHKDHNYYVSNLGILAHNNCADVKLTKGGRKQIGNMGDLKNTTAADAIKSRGGGAGQVRQLKTGYENKTVGELANLAAQGDADAVTAMKIIKQASKKAQKYGDK